MDSFVSSHKTMDLLIETTLKANKGKLSLEETTIINKANDFVKTLSVSFLMKQAEEKGNGNIVIWRDRIIRDGSFFRIEPYIISFARKHLGIPQLKLTYQHNLLSTTDTTWDGFRFDDEIRLTWIDGLFPLEDRGRNVNMDFSQQLDLLHR